MQILGRRGSKNGTLVSVVIPTFNAVGFLPTAIESVLEQTYKNIEVVVVDDGSTDETAETVRKYPVTYIKIEHSGGPATPRNVGIEKAMGELVAFLDSDDIWLPKKLEKQVNFMEKGRFDFVSSDAGVIDERGKRTKKSYLEHLGKLKSLGYDAFPELYKRNFVVTSSVLVKRIIFDRAGLFDQSPELVGVEDYDLWLRTAARGAKFGFLRESSLLYRDRAGSLSVRVQSLNYEREFRVIVKNFKLAKRFLGAKSRLRPFSLSRAGGIASKEKDLGKYLKYKLLCFWYFPFGAGSLQELWPEFKSVVKM